MLSSKSNPSSGRTVLGIAEIALSVADLPKMRDFYCHVLGFQVNRELSMENSDPVQGGVPTIVFLTIAELDTPLGRNGHPPMLVLIDYQRHVYARSRFHGHEVGASTLNHLAFEIPPESFNAHVDHLRANDIEPTFSEFPEMSARAIFFRDPEGNTLELICHHRSV